MGRSQYYVLFDGGAWKIQCDGENSEPYAERRDAFKDAVALAHLDDTNGRAAAVIVQGEDAMFRFQHGRLSAAAGTGTLSGRTPEAVMRTT